MKKKNVEQAKQVHSLEKIWGDAPPTGETKARSCALSTQQPCETPTHQKNTRRTMRLDTLYSAMQSKDVGSFGHFHRGAT